MFWRERCEVLPYVGAQWEMLNIFQHPPSVASPMMSSEVMPLSRKSRKNSKIGRASVLVKMSAICFPVEISSKRSTFRSYSSRMKCCLSSKCLFLPLICGQVTMERHAALSSYRIAGGNLFLGNKNCTSDAIHLTCFPASVTAQYSASAVESATHE